MAKKTKKTPAKAKKKAKISSKDVGKQEIKPKTRPEAPGPIPEPTPPKAEPDQVEDLQGLEDLLGLPKRDLFRINEVAQYFSVSESTIRTWIQHGHFQIEKLRGTIWVPRASILKFRLKSRVN